MDDEKRNYWKTDEEEEAGFDIKYFEAREKQQQYAHLSGDIDFLMAECGGCRRTMPFEFDDGVCMLCGCDAAEGIIHEMTEQEFDELIRNNKYNMKLPFLKRRPFEDCCQLIDRQIRYRAECALEHYKKKKNEEQTSSESKKIKELH